MEECKICNKELVSNRALSKHLDCYHDIKFLEYKIQYEKFEKPKCPVCEKTAKFKSGLSYQTTCGGKDCISVLASNRTHSEESKQRMREKRLAYMKANPRCTAWRTGNEMSWPEKVFINAVERHGWYDRFEITREKSFYPYFVDFAFENVKVAVEIDGKQHELPERKASDNKKDALLISQGWRVYRVKAKQTSSDINTVLKDLESFIGDIETNSKTCELLTGKEKREIEANKKRKKRREKTEKLIKEREVVFETVDISEWGWVQKVADIWKLSHAQTKRWIKKYHPDLEYHQR